jgi:hypothetical protein
MGSLSWTSAAFTTSRRHMKKHCNGFYRGISIITKEGYHIGDHWQIHQAWAFITLKHPFTAQDVTQLFLDHFYKFHGLLTFIVIDRDKIFTSLFCKELFILLGVKLLISFSYHPQTNGQSEQVNQCLKIYLRYMTMHNPKKWIYWLWLA